MAALVLERAAFKRAVPLEDYRAPTRKSFRFTPAVLRQVRRLVREGQGGEAIAAKLGCSYGSLRTVCARRGITLRPASRSREIRVELSRRAKRALALEARSRKVTLEQLAEQLLEVIAADKICGAVLDSESALA